MCVFVSARASGLVSALTSKRQEDRPSAVAVLGHEWVREGRASSVAVYAALGLKQAGDGDAPAPAKKARW